jgi:outer membrane protein assembly factor BamE
LGFRATRLEQNPGSLYNGGYWFRNLIIDLGQDNFTMKKLLTTAFIFASATLVGCSVNHIPGVYRINVQQGNVITPEMVAQLEPGMEKRTIRLILGTPLISDPFNPDRWDYLYSFQPGGGERSQRKLTLFFEQDQLTDITGDIRAASSGRKGARQTQKVVSVPEKESGDGLLGFLVRPFEPSEGIQTKDDDTDELPDRPANKRWEGAE